MKVQNRMSSFSRADSLEVEKISARHEELYRRVMDLEAQGRSIHYIASTLAADFDGLMQSIGRWIARQDVKAARGQ